MADSTNTTNGNATRRESASVEERFAPFVQKMQSEGLPDDTIRMFRHYYSKLVRGETGQIPTQDAQPIEHLPTTNELKRYREAGKSALDRAVVIKLNGGLGTTMGMHGPKSLVEVKNGLSFLDIIVRQILHMRRAYGTRLPLVLMNSFNTQDPSRALLDQYPELHQDVPLDFVQHKVPRIWKADLTPVVWPAEPAREWCPPGHGDIYLSLQTSGTLDQLLAQGYEYAFVSNADNLGATMDLEILGYFAAEKIPFLLEAAERKPMDRKGGHLGLHPEKGLVLREIAQCPPEELAEFQDIERYRYFNTNNLWIHLPTLRARLREHGGFLDLPLIRNEKPVDPTRPETPPVYQLETAMGQAIALFPSAQAVQVRRRRFLPVKSTNDLLALWSDAYVLNDDYTMALNPARTSANGLIVQLDTEHYGLFEQLKAHFADGVPSLVRCEKFQVEGNIYFDASAVFEGEVHLQHSADEPLRWTGGARRAVS